MLFRMFRKPSNSGARFEQDASLAEALQRRIETIQFEPTKGFLKDQWQPRRLLGPANPTAAGVRKTRSSP